MRWTAARANVIIALRLTDREEESVEFETLRQPRSRLLFAAPRGRMVHSRHHA